MVTGFSWHVVDAQSADEYSMPRFFRTVMGVADSLETARSMRTQAIDSIYDYKFRQAELILTKALGIAERFNDRRLANNILNNLAECYSCTGRHPLAVDTYLALLKNVSLQGDTSSMASVLINLGDEYAKAGKLELAASAELQAIRLKEQSGNLKKLAFYYQKLGELFSATDRVKWEYYINKALQLSRDPETTTWYANVAIYNDLGAIWSKKGDYVVAEAYYDTMYRLSREADYRNGIATATSEKALLLFEQGRYAEALPLARESHQASEPGESIYKSVYSATLLASILLKMNQYDEAERLLVPALTRARASKLMPEAVNALKKLTETHRMKGEWMKAFDYQQQWIGLKDSLDGVEIRRSMNDLQTRFETGKKQQLIDRLNEQNLNQRRRNHQLTALLVVSISLLVMLVFLLRLRSRTIRQNRELHDQQQLILKLENERLTTGLEYKSRELTAATMHLLNKNEVLADLKDRLTSNEAEMPDLKQVVRKIDQNLNLDKDWNNFRRHFEDVHPTFFIRIKEKYPGLTPNEERLCAYLRISLNTKEISNMLNVTTAAVDKSRNRLRKKFDISPEVNLAEFIGSI